MYRHGELFPDTEHFSFHLIISQLRQWGLYDLCLSLTISDPFLNSGNLHVSVRWKGEERSPPGVTSLACFYPFWERQDNMTISQMSASLSF
jgi:hypothetical protein